MSDDMAPSHLWVTEDGALSHHRPSDHTAVQYTQTSLLHSEVERLTEHIKERERVWAERERVAMAHVAELTSAARELLEATDTLAIAAARRHLRRTLAAARRHLRRTLAAARHHLRRTLAAEKGDEHE